MKYDTIVYIGRFQPFHNAHLETLVRAFSLAKQVVIVIGSANQPRDEDNPFTASERCTIIASALFDLGINNFKFVCVENTAYNNDAWATRVAEGVEQVTDSTNVAIIGHSKDESSFYLKMFPQWDSIDQPMIEVLDATTIRQLYFSDKCNLNFFKSVVPPATLRFLAVFIGTSEYKYICEEAEYIRNYKKPYENLPYPPTFNTGDACIFKAGHVVMIERKASPGKGLLAFPGGFLNANTDASLLDCAIRELYEETKIKVPEKVIRGSIKEEKVFDAKNRSRRGRIITTAQFIVLPPDELGLPKVKGSDDARYATWLPYHKIQRNECFEDHYDMLQYFIGKLS